jgi:hypothetical protein
LIGLFQNVEIRFPMLSPGSHSSSSSSSSSSHGHGPGPGGDRDLFEGDISEFSRRIIVREGFLLSPTAIRDDRQSPDLFWVPSPIQALRTELFQFCDALRLIAFEAPSRLERIDDAAFLGCGLLTVMIPASVTVLGEACFHDCWALASVTFEAGS